MAPVREAEPLTSMSTPLSDLKNLSCMRNNPKAATNCLHHAEHSVPGPYRSREVSQGGATNIAFQKPELPPPACGGGSLQVQCPCESHTCRIPSWPADLHNCTVGHVALVFLLKSIVSKIQQVLQYDTKIQQVLQYDAEIQQVLQVL